MVKSGSVFTAILSAVHSVGSNRDLPITAHEGDWGHERFAPHSWRKRKYDGGTYDQPFRVCSYCGSINPDDLLDLSKTNDLLFEVADWKYGWPHKIYVEGIPNKVAGKTVNIGSRTEKGKTVKLKGKAPTSAHCKFYTKHIVDIRNVDGLTTLIFMKTGIHFEVKEGKLRWRIPKLPKEEPNAV